MWAVACWANRPACAVIKHTTPCGIAVGAVRGGGVPEGPAPPTRCPRSASVIAFNTVVDQATAEAMSDLFVEVVVAPSFHADALAVFAAKKNLRVVELPVERRRSGLDWKSVRGGFLVQDQFRFDPSEEGWKVVTTRGNPRMPSGTTSGLPGRRWRRSSRTRSSWPAEQAIGIGAGQMSRVDSAFLAVHKARQQGHRPAACSPPTGSSPSPTASKRRPGRRPGDHPAGRLGPRRRGDRGRQPVRHRDGAYRQADVQALSSER